MGDWLVAIYYNHSSNRGKFFIPTSFQQVGLSYAHASNALPAIFALDLLHTRYIRDVDSWTLLYQKPHAKSLAFTGHFPLYLHRDCLNLQYLLNLIYSALSGNNS